MTVFTFGSLAAITASGASEINLSFEVFGAQFAKQLGEDTCTYGLSFELFDGAALDRTDGCRPRPIELLWCANDGRLYGTFTLCLHDREGWFLGPTRQ